MIVPFILYTSEKSEIKLSNPRNIHNEIPNFVDSMLIAPASIQPLGHHISPASAVVRQQVASVP